MPAGHVKKHHSPAEKQAIILEIERRMKAEGRGVKPLARELGIAACTYYNWLREGVRPVPTASVAPKPSPGQIEPAERARIMAAVRASLAAGTPIKVSAREHGITEGTFYRWVREAARGPEPKQHAKPGGEQSRALVVATPRPPALTFRPVSVAMAPPAPPAPLVLVAPSGHRIEGLDVTGAAALLRALA